MFGIPKILFTDHMKPKNKEYKNVDVPVLLRRGNKILTGENAKTKCWSLSLAVPQKTGHNTSR